MLYNKNKQQQRTCQKKISWHVCKKKKKKKKHNFSMYHATNWRQISACPGWLYIENFLDNRQKKSLKSDFATRMHSKSKETAPNLERKGISARKWIMLSEETIALGWRTKLTSSSTAFDLPNMKIPDPDVQPRTAKSIKDHRLLLDIRRNPYLTLRR